MTAVGDEEEAGSEARDLGRAITIAWGLGPRPQGNSLPLPSDCARLWCGVPSVGTPDCIHRELCAPSRHFSLAQELDSMEWTQQFVSILPGHAATTTTTITTTPLFLLLVVCVHVCYTCTHGTCHMEVR